MRSADCIVCLRACHLRTATRESTRCEAPSTLTATTEFSSWSRRNAAQFRLHADGRDRYRLDATLPPRHVELVGGFLRPDYHHIVVAVDRLPAHFVQSNNVITDTTCVAQRCFIITVLVLRVGLNACHTLSSYHVLSPYRLGAKRGQTRHVRRVDGPQAPSVARGHHVSRRL